MNEQTQVHWDGPGWYGERASCGPRGEDGVHAWIISHRKDARPDELGLIARGSGLGTPFWLDKPEAAND